MADSRSEEFRIESRGGCLCDVVVLRIAIRVQFLCATDDANSPARSGAPLCLGERPPRRVETTFQPRPSSRRIDPVDLSLPFALALALTYVL
jgi:hypothetical protein